MRTKSSNSAKESQRGERLSKASPATTSSTPRSARPNLTARTSSAPLVPLAKDPKLSIADDEFDEYNHRDSVASLKDDPFFRNYQSPDSVSIARELRSAAYSERLRDEGEGIPEEPPPRSARRPSVDDSVNLPVRIPHTQQEI
jgi:hypothetical protein